MSVVAWGVPDYGVVSERTRVSSLLSQSGTMPCLVFGSSGAGKSVAAAQYAASSIRPVVWIDAAGEVLSLERITVAALSGLRQAAATPHTNSDHREPADSLAELIAAIGSAAEAGINIVVDDLGSDDAAGNIPSIMILARSLRMCSSRIIVTTRSTAQWPAQTLSSWALVGPDDLALTHDEAVDLLSVLGLDALATQADEVLEACGGHLAAFSILASQSSKYGVQSAVERTAKLDAWMQGLVHGGSSTNACLIAAAVLGTGDSADLSAMGVDEPTDTLRLIAESLPLVRCTRLMGPTYQFRVHDLLRDFVMENLESGGLEIADAAVEAAVNRLGRRADIAKVMDVLSRLCSAETKAQWLEQFGQAALSQAMYPGLESLLKSLPIHLLMARPRVLMLWAELCSELGRTEDAYTKCQAARSLAEHAGDADTLRRALSLSMQSMCRLYRFDEAELLSREILESPQGSDPGMRSEALTCLARTILSRGQDANHAVPILEEAARLTSGEPAAALTRQTLTFLAALVPVLSHGDWTSGARILTPLVYAKDQLVSSRIMAMGNLGWMLNEAGRLTRAQELLGAAVSEARRFELDGYIGAYAPPLGYVTVGSGAVAEGLELIREGIELSVRLGDATEAATDRVHYSTVLRSIGRHEESLAQAEQAFDVLSRGDNIGFRRLAALEIAASLFALKDSTAARRWADSAVSRGPNLNGYHLLRADLIAALIDHDGGDDERAIERLASHSDHVVSGNSNWQAAMYCRAFPQLLGLLAAATGVERLPSHLLRMVLPEHAEAALGLSRSLLGLEPWRVLGRRLIGLTEFAELESRDGLPLCHVRMFGGLQVSVDGRIVRERDWKKRKARLLFCMLVVRNGQDIARDRLFDSLWSDMDGERARGNMYVVWSAIKAALMVDGSDAKARCPYVESVGGVCRSVQEYVRTDVSAFELALVEAREAEAAGVNTAAIAAYKRLAEIYQGDLLPGDLYDDWFSGLRDHYRLEFIDAMARASGIHLADNDPHSGVMCARRALQQDPTREDLYQAVIRCQIAAGHRSSAIDTYMQCRTRLSEDLGLDPSPETRSLYGQILAMEESPNSGPYDLLSD